MLLAGRLLQVLQQEELQPSRPTGACAGPEQPMPNQPMAAEGGVLGVDLPMEHDTPMEHRSDLIQRTLPGCSRPTMRSAPGDATPAQQPRGWPDRQRQHVPLLHMLASSSTCQSCILCGAAPRGWQQSVELSPAVQRAINDAVMHATQAVVVPAVIAAVESAARDAISQALNDLARRIPNADQSGT
jgi:hypothetical protein